MYRLLSLSNVFSLRLWQADGDSCIRVVLDEIIWVHVMKTNLLFCKEKKIENKLIKNLKKQKQTHQSYSLNSSLTDL